MDFLEDIGKKAEKAAKDVTRRAQELKEIARLKNMVHTCEEVVERHYRDIGKAYYEAYGQQTDGEFFRQCRAIADAKKGIEELQAQIARVGMEEDGADGSGEQDWEEIF